MNRDELIAETQHLIEYHQRQLRYLSCVMEGLTFTETGPITPVDAALKVKIEEFEFSTRTLNVLTRMGIITFADMIAVSQSTYLREDNFGRKCLSELIDVADRYGYRIPKYPIAGQAR